MSPHPVDLLYFVILVSSLIFVHELGHFLFAKAFGVKVLTFSLGFGPKILRLRGRETEYCVGLLPLGGYVKMLEQSKSDIVLPEDRKRTFESLALYKRILVVMAGPMMNLIFPVLLYFAVFLGDGPFLPPTVGVVLPGHAAYGKLEPGDRVMAVNGESVRTFDELKRIVAKNPGKVIHFKVFRDEHYVKVNVRADSSEPTDLQWNSAVASNGAQVQSVRKDLGIVQHVGTVGIQPSSPAAVIGIPNPDSPAYRAGLRTFDVITYVAGRRVRRYMDLVKALKDNHGETVPVTYLRPIDMPNALGGLADMAVFTSGVVALTPDPSGVDFLGRTGIEVADLYAAIVPHDSYLYKAGLRQGDKILKLDDKPVPAWSTFRERVLAAPNQPHRIDYLAARDGHVRSGTFQVRREDFTDEYGQAYSRYVLRVQHWVPFAPEKRVTHTAPVRYAFAKAIDETVDVTHFTLVGIVRLIQGRISLKSLSGPITIYEVAGEEGRKGTDYFIWVMALVSINLGLLNLLPIPVLDGGHLFFFAVEGALRRPLPLRVREVAHLVGMVILLFLMGIAFKNDIQRRWDVIWGQVRDLTGMRGPPRGNGARLASLGDASAGVRAAPGAASPRRAVL